MISLSYPSPAKRGVETSEARSWVARGARSDQRDGWGWCGDALPRGPHPALRATLPTLRGGGKEKRASRVDPVVGYRYLLRHARPCAGHPRPFADRREARASREASFALPGHDDGKLQRSSMPSLRGVKRRSNPAFLAGPRWIASLALAMTQNTHTFAFSQRSPLFLVPPPASRRRDKNTLPRSRGGFTPELCMNVSPENN